VTRRFGLKGIITVNIVVIIEIEIEEKLQCSQNAFQSLSLSLQHDAEFLQSQLFLLKCALSLL